MGHLSLRTEDFDILKTIDSFESKKFKALNGKNVNFLYVEANNFFLNTSSINAEFDGNNIYFTVINNKNVFKHLTNSWNRYLSKKENENSFSKLY